MGERPAVWTKPRRYAPAGAKVFGEVFENADFGDEALVILDWDNSWRVVPGDEKMPMMYVIVQKKFPDLPQPNVLLVDVKLDVNDVFSDEAVTATTIQSVVDELRVKVSEALTEKLKP